MAVHAKSDLGQLRLIIKIAGCKRGVNLAEIIEERGVV